MSGARPQEVPRGALLGAGALLAATLTLAAGMRWSGATLHPTAPVPRLTRSLWFADLPSGGVRVLEAPTARTIAVLAPGTNGFVRATLRTLVQERRTLHVSATEPFRLIADGSGRVVLEDPATGRSIELEAFGPTNAAAFARLLTDPAAEPPRSATLKAAGASAS